MQSRFWISNHPTTIAAYQAKNALQRENPEAVYQVRKGRNGGKIVFRLVQRFKKPEAEVINHLRGKK